jgi:hypothetical protein
MIVNRIDLLDLHVSRNWGGLNGKEIKYQK